MVFVNTIDEVEYLDFLLNNMKYRDSNGNFTEEKIETRKIFKIHGDLDQKYRSNTYFEFKKEKVACILFRIQSSLALKLPVGVWISQISTISSYLMFHPPSLTMEIEWAEQPDTTVQEFLC